MQTLQLLWPAGMGERATPELQPPHRLSQSGIDGGKRTYQQLSEIGQCGSVSEPMGTQKRVYLPEKLFRFFKVHQVPRVRHNDANSPLN